MLELGKQVCSWNLFVAMGRKRKEERGLLEEEKAELGALEADLFSIRPEVTWFIIQIL